MPAYFFADARGRALQEQAEVARFTHFHAPVGNVALAVRDALAPIAAWVADEDAVFRNHVFAGHKFHAVEAQGAIVAHDVAQLNESRPPIDRIKAEAEKSANHSHCSNLVTSGFSLPEASTSRKSFCKTLPLRWSMHPERWVSRAQSAKMS